MKYVVANRSELIDRFFLYYLICVDPKAIIAKFCFAQLHEVSNNYLFAPEIPGLPARFAK